MTLRSVNVKQWCYAVPRMHTIDVQLILMSRIHVILSEAQKVRYQSQASREGKSLGAWMREAAEEKLGRQSRERFRSPEELRAYLEGCWARAAADDGPDREPDWEETKKLIVDSKIRGLEEFL